MSDSKNKEHIYQHTQQNHILTKTRIQKAKEKNNLTDEEEEFLDKVLSLKEEYEDDKINSIAYDKNKNKIIAKGKSESHLAKKLIKMDHDSDNTIIIRV